MTAILETIFGTIIVGLLILSLVQVQTNFLQRNVLDTKSYNMQQKAERFKEELYEDIKPIGYNLTDFYHCILVADTNKIVFLTDLDGDALPDTVQIFTRTFPADPTPNNPFDKQIVRIKNGTLYDYNLVGLTKFKFRYYDNNNTETSTLDQIKLISFEYKILTPKPVVSGEEQNKTKYSAAVGEETVFSKNIYDW